MEIKIKDVMRTKVQTVDTNITVVEAVKTMKKYNIGSLVVVKGSEAAGIITSTDILYKGIANDLDLKNTTVERIMNSPLVTIDPEASLNDAAQLMTENQIKKLPVIKESGELVGIITTSDLVARNPEFLNVLINLAIPKKSQAMGG